MADTSSAVRILKRYDRLKADRGPFESLWQELADYLRPLRSEFTALRSPGEKRYGKVFDSTPLLSADNFAGGIYGMMTNPANRWFSLRVEDDDLNEFEPVRDWLYEVESRLLRSFGPQITGFYNVLPGLYADLAVFGTSIFYSEEIEGRPRIHDSQRALAECAISENGFGEVDTVYRRFTMEARSAVKLFPDKISQKTKDIADKEPFTKVGFIHCVEPNEEYEPERQLDNDRSKPFTSVYIEVEAKAEVSRKGYYEFPYQVPRWEQAAGEVYGRGLGETVLADVKTLNQQSKTSLEAAHKVANPPLAAPHEGVIRQARTYPGGITYGAVDANGRLLLQPLQTGGRLDITLEMMEQRRNSIREGFYFSLMQMVGTPDMTATEWIGRQEEKLRLMGKNLGRLQSEFLSPLIKRRYGILLRAGQIPPPPEEVSGVPLNIEYVSPLAKAQMASEAQSISRLYQNLLPVAQADPTIMDNVDHDEAARKLGRGFGVVPSVLRDPQEVEQIRAERQQQMAMANGMAMGEQASKAFKNVASGGKDVAAQQGEGGKTGGEGLMAAIDTIRKLISRGRAA